MLIQDSSAATVRISAICSTRANRSPSPASAVIAGTAASRGSRYSDWSSVPMLGVKSSLQWGIRSGTGQGRSLRGGGWPRGHAGRGGAGPGGGARPVPPPARAEPFLVAVPVLEPHLVVVAALPIGEHADAVGGVHDLVEMAGELPGRQVLVDVLAHP